MLVVLISPARTGGSRGYYPPSVGPHPRRLDKTKLGDCHKPMFTARNIHYDLADRSRGFVHGGIGVLHTLARQIGLIDAIDQLLHLLKIHLPFHESDHVLNFAYNALCDGTCLEDIELRRNDEVFLDALGARRIPDWKRTRSCSRRTTAVIRRTSWRSCWAGCEH